MIRVTKFQRSNGYWYVRYWLAAKPLDESTRTKAEAPAEAHRVRREIELNAGIQPIQYADVGNLVDPYLESMPPKTSETHKAFSRRVLMTFLQLCGRKGRSRYSLATQQITPETIDRWIHRRATMQPHDGTMRDRRGRKIVRKRKPSNVTMRTELRYLSGFFNWCCRQRPRYLRENPIPLSNAAKLKDDAKPHYMITEDELRKLLKACETPREYLFVLLGWWTGGRRGW